MSPSTTPFEGAFKLLIITVNERLHLMMVPYLSSSGGFPIYFMLPGASCHDVTRFRCRFGNIDASASTSPDGLVDAQYDSRVGALMCTAPPLPSTLIPTDLRSSVSVLVQLLANGVPLTSSRPLLLSYVNQSSLSGAQRQLLRNPLPWLCESCAMSVPSAVTLASLPTNNAAVSPASPSADPAAFASYFSSVCPLDCAGQWSWQGGASFDSCGQCAGSPAAGRPDRARDCRGRCFGPAIRTPDGACSCPPGLPSHACADPIEAEAAAARAAAHLPLNVLQVLVTVAVLAASALPFLPFAKRFLADSLSAIQDWVERVMSPPQPPTLPASELPVSAASCQIELSSMRN
jgi:hypothetical protein